MGRRDVPRSVRRAFWSAVVVEGVSIGEACRRVGVRRAYQECRDRPILPRDEGFDLALAIDDEFDGNGLHPPRRQTAADFRPQQR